MTAVKRSNNTSVAQSSDKKAKVASKIPDEYVLLDKYWRASNYLSVGQIYLLDKNPMLRRKLVLSDVRSRLLGHLLLLIPAHNAERLFSAQLAIKYMKVISSAMLSNLRERMDSQLKI